MSSILKALKKLEQNADTTSGMPAGIIVKPTDRPAIRPVIVKSLIIVTALAILAAVVFIINRKPAISGKQSPAIKTDQIRKESLPQQPVEPRIKTPIPMETAPSPSNEPAKTAKLDDAPAPAEIMEINDNVGLELQAISWSTDANKRLVIINGRIYREGEHVNGYVVKQINQADVMVSNGSTSGKLSFKIR